MRLGHLTDAVLRHRMLVLVLWLTVGIAGTLAGAALPDRLTALTSVPGSASASADQLLSKHFSEDPDGTFTIIVPFGNKSDAFIETLKGKTASAVTRVPTGRLVQQRALGGTLFAIVATELPLLDAAEATQTLRNALRSEGVAGAMVTGPPALEYDIRPMLADDLRLGAAIAVVAALLILLLMLGLSWAVLIPFVVAAAVVTGSLLVVFALAGQASMVMYIPNIIELIGLGLAVDYALLMVHRFRMEIGEHGSIQAIRSTMETAGRTVVVSGITAAAGLSVLFLTPVPFIRSLGAAGLIVPAVSVLAAVTLQPVLLAMLGTRAAPSPRWRGLLAMHHERALWTRFAQRVVHRARRTVAATALLLVMLASPLLALQVAPASFTGMPNTLESARGVEYLLKRVGEGAITPLSVLVDTGQDGGATGAAADVSRERVTKALSKLDGVFAVVSDTTTNFIDGDRRFQRFVIVSRSGFADPATRTLVEELRTLDPSTFGYSPSATIAVGGVAVRGIDFLDRIGEALPWVVLTALLVSYLLMARAFRSRVLPAVAVGLNLLSVAAAFGVVVAVFQWMLGEPRIEAWALVFLFAMLFGLSMDYQVFVVSRIREARMSGLSSQEAITHGLERTAGVIIAAALVFVAALGGLMVGHIAGLRELGVGLAAGVLIDATIVRALLLPSAMSLLGDRSWTARGPASGK